MGATSVFKATGPGPTAAAGAAGATGAAGAGAVQAKGTSLVNPSGYSSGQNSISTQLRNERESEWRRREPPDSTQHRLGTFSASDGSQVTVKMSDLKSKPVFDKDGVTLAVAAPGGQKKSVTVDHATYSRMREAFKVSKNSWKESYSRWRDEGEFNGFVSGYDGVGQKAARRTEF